MSNVLNMVSEDAFTEQTDGIVSAINAIGGGGGTVELFVVTNTFDAENNRLIADKTFGEIKAAADSGKFIIIKTVIEGYVDDVSYLASCNVSGQQYFIIFVGGDGNIENWSGSRNDYPTRAIT